MSLFDIRIHEGAYRFEPGERLEGVASWKLDRSVDAMEIRLVWSTLGKGTGDVGFASTTRIERPPIEGKQPFSFLLPHGPYSFEGKLISLNWAVEVAVLPKGESQRSLIILAPGRSPVILPGQ